MPSIINATTTNGVAVSGDNSGSLALQTNNGTTAVTIDTSQNVGVGTTTMTRQFNVGGSNPGNGVSLQNTGTSGKSWSIFSTNSSASIGGGSLGFFNDTDSAYRMIIDTAGRVTTPSQPRAYVEWGASSVTGGATLTFSGGSVNVNVGSIYNGSNGRFTAPVNGVYRLTMGSQGKQAAQNDSGSLYYALNGSGLQGQLLFYGPAYNGNHSDYLFSLNANDYVQVQSFGNNGNSFTLNGVRATFELVG